MIKSQEYSSLLEKLFNPEDETLRIDLNILKEISNSQDYHRLIDLTSILTRLFLAGKQRLSISQLIGKTVQKQKQEKQSRVEFFVDSLSSNELYQLITQLFQIRKKLKHTIYSSRLYSMNCSLRTILQQRRPQGQKSTDGLGQLIVGDFEVNEEQIKKSQAISPLFLDHNQFGSKIMDLLKNPKNFLEGKFSNYATLQSFMAKEIFPLLERSVLTIPLNSHNERQGELSRILKFINQFYISQYKIEVEITKNTLVQTRIYTNKLYKQSISRNYLELLKNTSKIINQAILCPSSIHIQLLLLRILRRIYLLEDASTHSSENLQSFRTSDPVFASSPGTAVKNPLYLVLRNISLFSEGHDEELKEAAMFCYKISNDKNDLELAAMIENSDDMRFLRSSKYFTSKAYIYSQESEKVYELSELGSLYLKLHQSIGARQIWSYTVLIQKPSSLICWEFYLGGYDLRFGVFKVESLRDYTQEEYEQGVGCKQVLKLDKVQNNFTNPCKGHVFVKNGIYRLVFDNSFSLMRSKDLYYTFLHLQYAS